MDDTWNTAINIPPLDTDIDNAPQLGGYVDRGASVLRGGCSLAVGETGRFTMLDVGEAPEVPGLYAWYARFRASDQDWTFRPGPTGDQSIDDFSDLVQRYAQQFEPLALKLTGQGSYGSTWTGKVIPDFPFRDTDDGAHEVRDSAGALSASVETEHARKVVASILDRATPAFSTPLYIGVADNLRRRLTEHQHAYTAAYTWLKNNPEDMAAIREKGKSFGQRAAARGIAMEDLEAWTIDLQPETTGLSSDQLRKIAESVEWMLHRIYLPLLGRR